MVAYISLDEEVKQTILECIQRDGYIQAGYLKFMVDLRIAAISAGMSDDTEFLPSEINDMNHLTIKYKSPWDNIYQEKNYDVEEIIKKYLRS